MDMLSKWFRHTLLYGRGARDDTIAPFVPIGDICLDELRMSEQSSARLRFRALARQPESQFALAEAALCIAWEDHGQNNLESALRQLDDMAATVGARIDTSTAPGEIIDALNHYLFRELGFRGNTWDYDHTDNSYLDRVLETRVGLPIALSTIYMEIGWRLGLPLAGVALPGHFLTRYRIVQDGQEELYIDPFHQGRLWSRDECEQQIRRIYGSVTAPLIETIMRPPSRQAILLRMLRNLKHTYLANQQFEPALAAVERILLLVPNEAEEVRDGALLYANLGYIQRALENLERYAALAPAAADLAEIQRYAVTLTEQLARRN